MRTSKSPRNNAKFYPIDQHFSSSGLAFKAPWISFLPQNPQNGPTLGRAHRKFPNFIRGQDTPREEPITPKPANHCLPKSLSHTTIEKEVIHHFHILEAHETGINNDSSPASKVVHENTPLRASHPNAITLGGVFKIQRLDKGLTCGEPLVKMVKEATEKTPLVEPFQNLHPNPHLGDINP